MTASMKAASSASSWAEICQQYPNEWVMLLDVEDEASGVLRAGRLFAHDSSFNELLDNVGWPHPPNATLVHTWGRPVNMPYASSRLSMSSETSSHSSSISPESSSS